MNKAASTLGDDVLAAFKRACKEGDTIVAESLLQALEAMGARDVEAEYLEQAYLELARQVES